MTDWSEVTPLTDIILSTFKPDEKVFKAINSVINQEYAKWCLYIIDDASEDESLEKIRAKYCSHRDKIVFLQLSRNKRAAWARNYAISRGKGKYIALIDQDDEWTKDKLAIQINFMESNPRYGATHTDVRIFDKNGKYLKRKSEEDNNRRKKIPWAHIDKIELSRIVFMKPGTRLASTVIQRDTFERIGGFLDDYFGPEDWEFWTRIAKHCPIGHIDKPLLIRNIHQKNTGASMRYIRVRASLEYLKTMKTSAEYNYLSDLINAKSRQFLRQNILTSKENGNYKDLISLVLQYAILSIKK